MNKVAPGIFRPAWELPAGVHALQTTRAGGVALEPYASFNLGDHVGDDSQAVAANRARLRRHLPAEPVWLEQVHGIEVVDLDRAANAAASAVCAGRRPRADAAFARQPGRVCAVLTADCLPVLLCDDAGTVVAAAHAGWRGLAAGVLEAVIAGMAVAPARLSAWIGPAIGAEAFEVGGEVRAAFLDQDAAAAAAFAPAAPGKWMADLVLLAQQRLVRSGVARIAVDGRSTHRDAATWYSYRRDGRTGRMASLIWRAE